MGTNTTDQPGRAQPNESEKQPGFESEDEAQRGAERKGGFDEQRKDEVWSPPDPKRDRTPEQQGQQGEKKADEPKKY
jgi:hypothetical protein